MNMGRAANWQRMSTLPGVQFHEGFAKGLKRTAVNA